MVAVTVMGYITGSCGHGHASTGDDLSRRCSTECPTTHNDEDEGSKERKSSGWTKAYGCKLAKILARFLPAGTSSKQTGYFVQRNDDNLVSFALANYVHK
jgi:hypothetical protein